MNPSDEQAASRPQSAPAESPADKPTPSGPGAPAEIPSPQTQQQQPQADAQPPKPAGPSAPTVLPAAPAAPTAPSAPVAPSPAVPAASTAEDQVQAAKDSSAGEDEPAEDEPTHEDDPEHEPAAHPGAGEDGEESAAGQSQGSDAAHPQDRQPAAGGRGGKLLGDEPLVVVRYGKMNFIGMFRHTLEQPPRRGIGVVIRTQRGVELGEVLALVQAGAAAQPAPSPSSPAAQSTAAKDGQSPAGQADPAAEPAQPVPYELDDTLPCAKDCAACISSQRLETLMRAGEQTYDNHRANRILRLATPEDYVDQGHLDQAGREKLLYCREQAAQLKLPMRLIMVEHLFGGERVVFYFTSESRVDFRELVRRLAGQYRTRIEMRQIGARDEARLIGDYERCGQRCCCQQFLGTLQPVSIRMAKTQKATLDPTKISGRCGRLMCCLRYEDETYEDLRRRLPKRNTFVRTALGVGKVLETQILAQLVMLADGAGGVAVVENEAILERNVPEPTQPVAWAAAAQSARQAAPKGAHAAHGEPPAEDGFDQPADGEVADVAQPPSAVSAAAQGDQGSDADTPSPAEEATADQAPRAPVPARPMRPSTDRRPPQQGRPASRDHRPAQDRRPPHRLADEVPGGPAAPAPNEAQAMPPEEGEKKRGRRRRRRKGRGQGGEGQPQQRAGGPEGQPPRPMGGEGGPPAAPMSGAAPSDGAAAADGNAGGGKKRRRRRRRGRGHGGGGGEGSAPPPADSGSPPAQ